MTNQDIFTDWTESQADVWGHVPQRITHRLHEHPLFSDEALMRLIETHPREHYSLVQWGAQRRERGHWREGLLEGLNGETALEAVRKGRVFINLRSLPTVDKRYGELLDQIFEELRRRVPGMETLNRTMGVLISSPGSSTPYHSDLPGQSLWQIRGTKRVYVYPNTEPFIRPQHIEDVAVSGVEVNMPFEPWFDDYAQVYDLQPGQMLHWPLNAPHRVDNGDMMNVSMTLEYFTDEIRRSHMVTMANGIMRSKLGLTPRSHATTGPAFWSKAVFQKVMRKTPVVKRANKARKIPDFRLDPTRPDAIADLAPQA